jgi:hypothetical protein
MVGDVNMFGERKGFGSIRYILISRDLKCAMKLSILMWRMKDLEGPTLCYTNC